MRRRNVTWGWPKGAQCWASRLYSISRCLSCSLAPSRPITTAWDKRVISTKKSSHSLVRLPVARN